MPKRKIGLYLISSIVVGILLTACAGYATGQIGPETTTVIGGPAPLLWQSPLTQPFELAAPVEAVAQARLMTRSASQVVGQVETVFVSGHLCER